MAWLILEVCAALYLLTFLICLFCGLWEDGLRFLFFPGVDFRKLLRNQAIGLDGWKFVLLKGALLPLYLLASPFSRSARGTAKEELRSPLKDFVGVWLRRRKFDRFDISKATINEFLSVGLALNDREGHFASVCGCVKVLVSAGLFKKFVEEGHHISDRDMSWFLLGRFGTPTQSVDAMIVPGNHHWMKIVGFDNGKPKELNHFEVAHAN